MILGFRGREGGRIHRAGMVPGLRGREDTHSRDDPGFYREGGYTQQG